MRELKAGLGLVFGTFAGKLYLILILLAWIFVMFLWSMVDSRDLSKSGLSFWFFYMSLWPLSVGASQLAAGYKSVLSCGGLYCLPRLTKGMKRFSIIAGFVLAFMFTLPWFLVKNMNLQDTCICMAMSFTLLAAYFTGGSIPWPSTNKNSVSLITRALWVVIFIRILCAFFLNIHFLDGWPVTLAAGIFLCVIYCGPYKNKQIQSAHRQLAGSTTDINEKPQQAKLQITPNVERFFIGKLNRCPQKAKYLWGAIYPCIGTLLSGGRKTLYIAIVLAILSGFVPRPSSIIIVFVIVIIVISGTVLYIKLPVCSQMLIAGGRRERFYGTVATAIGFSLVTGLMFAVISIVSQLTAPIIPPFVYNGQTITFMPLTLYPAFIAIGLIPMIFGLGLCHERAPYLTDFAIIVISVPGLALIFPLCSIIIDATVRLISTTTFIISCWAFLIITAKIICYRKDLILQTDRI